MDAATVMRAWVAPVLLAAGAAWALGAMASRAPAATAALSGGSGGSGGGPGSAAPPAGQGGGKGPRMPPRRARAVRADTPPHVAAWLVGALRLERAVMEAGDAHADMMTNLVLHEYLSGLQAACDRAGSAGVATPFTGGRKARRIIFAVLTYERDPDATGLPFVCFMPPSAGDAAVGRPSRPEALALSQCLRRVQTI